MRKLVCICTLALVFYAPLAAGQTPLLPTSFGAWQSDGPSRIMSGQGLYVGLGSPDVKPDILREAGLLVSEQRRYSNGSEKLQINLYKFKDPSGAYEFYTQTLTPDLANAELGDESAFSQNNGAILIGDFVVHVDSIGSALKVESLKPLVPMLKAKADATPYPPLRDYLPKRWRVFGTEKYSQGPAGFINALDTLGQGAYRGLSRGVGFDTGVEAIFAKYQGEHGSGVLLLLQYPTPQLAEQHLHHLEDALPASAKQAGVTVERKASLLSLVFVPTSAMHAQAIRDEVNYETSVTWNEPHQTATDPPLVLILFKIFVFTTMFLVVATVAGILFGAFRVMIKHWLPGKVFDRPQDIEVLQLGLTGKKIDPTDMY